MLLLQMQLSVFQCTQFFFCLLVCSAAFFVWIHTFEHGDFLKAELFWQTVLVFVKAHFKQTFKQAYFGNNAVALACFYKAAHTGSNAVEIFVRRLFIA